MDVSNQVWTGLRSLHIRSIPQELLNSYLNAALSSNILSLHTLALGILTPPFIGFGDPQTGEETSIEQLVMLDTLIQRALFTLLAKSTTAATPQHLIQVPGEALLATVIDAVIHAIDLVKAVYADTRVSNAASGVGLTPSTAALSPLPGNAAQLLVQVLDSMGRADTVSPSDAVRILTHLNEIAQLRLGPAIVSQLSDWTNHLSYITLSAQHDNGGVVDGNTSSNPIFSAPPVAQDGNPDNSALKPEGIALPEGAEILSSIIIQRLLSEIPGETTPIL